MDLKKIEYFKMKEDGVYLKHQGFSERKMRKKEIKKLLRIKKKIRQNEKKWEKFINN